MDSEAVFMEAYKGLESALRDAGTDYRSYEDSAEPAKADRLRICRQMRNYLAHASDAGFLSVSAEQAAFLNAEAQAVRESGDVLAKHLRSVRTACVSPEDLLSDAMLKAGRLKTDRIPVADGGKFIGFLSIHDAVKAYLTAERPKKLKVGTDFKSCARAAFFAPEAPMEDVMRSGCGIAVCTDGGTSDGKLRGIWFA